MFQLAACIGYAKAHRTTWAIPQRRSAGDTFEDKPTPWLLPQFWPNLPTCYGSSGERYEQHDVSMFNYAPIPDLGKDLTLVGFFQSEKWFENAKEEVKKAFPLKYYPEYEGYVSIHVRRGDYVTNAGSFPPVTKGYLYNAMFTIWEKTKSNKFLIFSDDLQWCKDLFNIGYKIMVGPPDNVNLSTENGDFTFEFNEDTNEYTALSKMASCSHHIIANSTFSWWAAYLGFNQNRIVVSPHYENWFGPGFTGSPPKDLIPEAWTQIRFR